MYKLTTFFFALITSALSFCQNELPVVSVKTLTGEQKYFSEIVTADSDILVVVSLWATWCIPCIQELETINDQYEERQKDKPFKLIAISIDDTRTSTRVRSFVTGKGWTFAIYSDSNSDLKRALNINDIPHLLIIKKGKIVHQQNGYVPGNEEELFEKMKNL